LTLMAALKIKIGFITDAKKKPLCTNQTCIVLVVKGRLDTVSA
jgi:hypothetical protein